MPKKTESRRVTLADIARRAGVSSTTVSLILSERPEWIEQFHPDTVRSVREIADRLHYRTNLLASGLPRNAAPFIALVIRDFGQKDPTDWHLWAFEGELLVGVTKVGPRHRLYPIVAFADEHCNEESLAPIARVIEGGVFGSIVRTPNAFLEKHLLARIKRGYRIVVVFPYTPSHWPTNAISIDNAEVGRAAGELLARQGRRKWVMALYEGLRPRESHALRLQGFREQAQRVGASVEVVRLPRLIDDVTPEHIERFRKLAGDGYCGADSVLSVCTLQMCFEAGLEPHRDFSLVGVNCSRWLSLPMPRITSVEVSWRDVGRLAVRKLHELSADNDFRFESILIRPKVVPGDTCVVPGTPAPSLEERSDTR